MANFPEDMLDTIRSAQAIRLQTACGYKPVNAIVPCIAYDRVFLVKPPSNDNSWFERLTDTKLAILFLDGVPMIIAAEPPADLECLTPALICAEQQLTVENEPSPGIHVLEVRRAQ
ncbi:MULTISPECIES: hypothetical protein [Pseudovibrio]|uniref:hypothetical protein n=1 Tax=Stappiaceae TaxID=2821832 RepID=UPI002365493B|nr:MULTISPECIES: hypothetical protein [Pseudovibrio]MDD7911754.1 hypothetical protein [Pseudovibrio exalbescens]MDX5594797.1 hypothetical protein [Pseudovibrio sp. SPO723]